MAMLNNHAVNQVRSLILSYGFVEKSPNEAGRLPFELHDVAILSENRRRSFFYVNVGRNGERVSVRSLTVQDIVNFLVAFKNNESVESLQFSFQKDMSVEKEEYYPPLNISSIKVFDVL